MWPNPQFPADLVTFTEEIINGKVHLYSACEWVITKEWKLKQLTATYFTFSYKIGVVAIWNPSKCKLTVVNTEKIHNDCEKSTQINTLANKIVTKRCPILSPRSFKKIYLTFIFYFLVIMFSLYQPLTELVSLHLQQFV